MDRVIKLNFGLFLGISFFSIFVKIFKSGFSSDWDVFLIIFLFNICLGILVILMVKGLVKFSKRGYRIFIFYLILSSIIYWYLVSVLMHFYYGSFLSLGGFYYFLVTRTFVQALIFYICSGVLILGISFVMYYFLRKNVFENNPKIINKKLLFFFILIPIFVLVLLIVLIPKGDASDTNPLIENMIYYFKINAPIVENVNISENYHEPILNISLDVKEPNFIIIMLESLSAEHLSFYGYERNITPNINSFALISSVFDNYHVTASHSDYAQTSFLSSRYTLINSYRNFFNDDSPRSFMWDVLKKENYSTAYISSQDDDWANMKDYYNKKNLDVYQDSLYDGEFDYGSGNARKDYDERTIGKVIDWVNETSGPFFLYLNLQATHYPYVYPENNSLFEPSEPSSDTSYFYIPKKDFNASLNDYDNSIYYVDKQIGIFLSYLSEDGFLDNTIVVLSADHGETIIRRHGLRHGFGVYEEEVNIPLMIYFPGEKHKLISKNVRSIDVVPTLLNISGFELMEDFQGEPMVTNQNSYFVAQNQNFKLGILKGDIKYMVNGFTHEPEVYNLTSDPYEEINLIKTNDDKVFYYLEYGILLYKWYYCQLDYYSKKDWSKNIDC